MISNETNMRAVSNSLPLVINENLSLINNLDMTAHSKFIAFMSQSLYYLLMVIYLFIYYLFVLIVELSKELDRSVRKHKKSGAKIISKKIIKKRELADIIVDSKNRLAMSAYDLIDKHVRLIDEELNALDVAILACSDPATAGTTFSAAQPIEESIPLNGAKVAINEPMFCICRKIAHGEMIACDNEDCLIEWFHFACVGLTKLPRKGTNWYCPDCTAAMKH
jgi:hypothetical protein